VSTRFAASISLPTPQPIVALANERRPFGSSPGGQIRRQGVASHTETRNCFECTKKSAESGLLERARDGDHSAFGELSEQCRARLLAVARRIVRNEADAQDSVQDSLLSAFVNLRRFDGRSAFFTWVTRITINCCLMKLRSRRKYHRSRMDAECTGEEYEEIKCAALNPEEAAARDEESRLLRAAVGSLPKTLRIVVEIRDLQDRSIKETASLLGISVGAAKARLLRARGLLGGRLSVRWGRAIRESSRAVA
jgi:RNA polymerase sigma-70 factor (ECF subfamily)